LGVTGELVAGVFDPRGGAGDVLLERLGARGSNVEICRGGALTALRRRGQARSEGFERSVLCLMSGRLFDTENLCQELGATSDDTDERLISLAYARWGEEMLTRLRGTFALLIWDRAAGRGLLAQDQTGSRAIFLHSSCGRLAFAVEVRDLLPLLSTRPVPDQVALVHWLATRTQFGDRTLYDGVRRLGAARFLRLEAAGSRKHRYWTPEYSPPLAGSRGELTDRVRAALFHAVTRRTKGRAPGVLLSGGLDSTVITGLARSAAPQGTRPRAYSAVYPDDELTDESQLIADTVSSLELSGTGLHFAPQGVMATSLEYLRDWHLPLLAPGYMIELELSKLASRDGVTVLLDGQGGDELFGGAPYLIAERLRRGRLLAAVSLARRFPPTTADLRPGELVRWVLREYGVKGALPWSVHRLLRARDPRRYAPDELSASSARLLAETEDPWSWKRRGDVPIWWAHLADSLTAAWERDGRFDGIRHRAAATGVESGSPLLDSELVDLFLRLPPDHGFDPRLGRRLVRESMEGLIPDSVRLNPLKANFAPFWYRTLAGPDRPPIERLLERPDSEIYAYVDRDFVRERVLEASAKTHWRGQNRWAVSAWNLATLEAWLRSQADPDLPVRALEEWQIPRPDALPVPVDRAR